MHGMKKFVVIAALALIAIWVWMPSEVRESTSAEIPIQTDSAAPTVRRVFYRAPRPSSPGDVHAAVQRVHQLADSANRGLFKVPNLTITEVGTLKRDVNEVQISRARRLGVSPTLDLHREIAAGRLVELSDSTEYWTLRNMDYSVPYVTPATQQLLVEIGQRFHHKLDSLGIPRFRMVITSALRTPEKQAMLRRVNSNASRVESAHEFGTTVDVSYRRFAAPVGAALVDDVMVQTAVDSVLVKAATNRGAELQAILGRVILEMREEGKLLVRMERRQPVYHMTVNRGR